MNRRMPWNQARVGGRGQSALLVRSEERKDRVPTQQTTPERALSAPHNALMGNFSGSTRLGAGRSTSTRVPAINETNERGPCLCLNPAQASHRLESQQTKPHPRFLSRNTSYFISSNFVHCSAIVALHLKRETRLFVDSIFLSQSRPHLTAQHHHHGHPQNHLPGEDSPRER
jgi:hypothetical protein